LRLDQTLLPRGALYISRSLSPLFEPALALAVTELAKHAAGLDLHLQTLNQVVRFCPFLLQTEAAPVLKLPRCPSCSEAALRPAPRVWVGGS
jgi:hypothetical protein